MPEFPSYGSLLGNFFGCCFGACSAGKLPSAPAGIFGSWLRPFSLDFKSHSYHQCNENSKGHKLSHKRHLYNFNPDNEKAFTSSFLPQTLFDITLYMIHAVSHNSSAKLVFKCKHNHGTLDFKTPHFEKNPSKSYFLGNSTLRLQSNTIFDYGHIRKNC